MGPPSRTGTPTETAKAIPRGGGALGHLKAGFSLIKAAAKEWSDDNAPRLGAALAYYTLFSLAPMLIVAIAVAGAVFGDEAARGQIVGQLQGLVGVDGGHAIQAMLESARKPTSGVIATVVGLAAFLFGATGAFAELQGALNTVWNVIPKPGRGIKGVIRDRLLSFGMVLAIGFLLLVSLVLSAGLAALGKVMGGFMPGWVVLGQILNIAVSFGVVTLLFAMIYKVLPDVRLAWSDVLIGAAFTSLLFTVGKLAIGLYLGKSTTASAYGAAGSLVVLLVWVYYSSQILLFGAEFTQVYADRYGSHVRPASNAIEAPKAKIDRNEAQRIAKEAAQA